MLSITCGPRPKTIRHTHQVQDPSARPLPGCIVMSDGRFKFSTEQQQAAFVHRQAGAVLPYYEAARVANSFYAKQHGCGARRREQADEVRSRFASGFVLPPR